MLKAVLYDSQVFAEQRHGGVSRYFAELIRALAVRRNWEPLLAGGIHVYPLPNDAGIRRVGWRLRVPPFPRRVQLLQAMNGVLAGRSLRESPAVYHPTWYHLPTIERYASFPLVITIHDLIPESWPAVTTPTQIAHRKEAISRARFVVCVSEATRSRLVHHYPEAGTKARVAYLGLTLNPEVARARFVRQAPYPTPYLIWVGKRGSYKDFPTLLEGLRRTDPGVGLVVAGGGKLERRYREVIERAHMGGQVWNEPAPSRARLTKLLTASAGLVSASREEGFGLPALEALCAGVPAVLSDIPVYRELYGEWAAFFQVGQPDSLASVIREVIKHPPPRVEADKLMARFSWDHAAAVAEQAYENAAAGAP